MYGIFFPAFSGNDKYRLLGSPPQCFHGHFGHFLLPTGLSCTFCGMYSTCVQTKPAI